MFFLVVASLQVLYGLGLLVRKERLAVSPWYLGAGVLGSLLLIEVYVISRTLGIPLGSHAGHVEEMGALDLFSKALEVGLVATLAVILVRLPGFKPSFGPTARLVTAGFLIVTVALVMAGVSTREEHEPFEVFPQPELQSPTGAPAQALPTLRDLLPLLTQSGWGPGDTYVDMVYAPPLLFQVDGEEPPASSLERPTVIFIMLEADHEHVVGLSPQPPQVFLRLDRGELIEPYEVTVLADGLEHRKSRLLFPLAPETNPEVWNTERHTLAISLLLESGGESVFSWQLPLVDLPGEAASPSVPDVATRLAASGLTQRLTRTLEDVQYKSRTGIRVEATYATPEYVAAALPRDAESRFLPEQFTLFLLTERLHTAELPDSPPAVMLNLGGKTYKPDLMEEVTTSPHHRVTLVRFPVEPPAGLRHQVMELLLPGDTELTWHLPISYAGLGTAPVRVTWVWLLAILGGLVAAMWPCLFQLTVFFIPALGGLSMHEDSSSLSFRRRASVVKAALFFVLGFTVVYTLAGAGIGFAAERLGGLSSFYTWQRYLGIAGGVVIVLLALRVAAQVRAPLVCKMPVLSHMSHRQRPANPLEMMIAGVAFATGCMTCFGAAIVVTMVMYVGLAGSALVGAFTLFLFSLGMGIPLVLASLAMAKVLPLLSRFENAIRWLGLASSLVMVGFAVLLITGNYMVLTEWVYRLAPGV